MRVKKSHLVAEQVLNPTQLLGKRRRPDDRVWDLVVRLDRVRVDRLAHIEVDPQTANDNNEVGSCALSFFLKPEEMM